VITVGLNLGSRVTLSLLRYLSRANTDVRHCGAVSLCYSTMRNNEIALRHAQSTRGGFVLVSLYSWMVITVGVVVARFVRGLVVHKIKFGADDAAALASIVGGRISNRLNV
jgi:hypothetical protein